MFESRTRIVRQVGTRPLPYTLRGHRTVVNPTLQQLGEFTGVFLVYRCLRYTRDTPQIADGGSVPTAIRCRGNTLIRRRGGSFNTN